MSDQATPAPRRRLHLILGAAAAVLAVVASYVAGYVTPQVTAPGEYSAEAGFARDMSLHHAQAVEMAMIAYPKATQPEVRTIALDIATFQEYQIGVMQTWLEQWGVSVNSDRPPMSWMPDGRASLGPGDLMPGMATAAELEQLRTATGKDLNILFCQLMLRHHLGGTHMVEAVLDLSDDPRVTDLAEKMRTTQAGELTNMQRILTELGAPAR